MFNYLKTTSLSHITSHYSNFSVCSFPMLGADNPMVRSKLATNPCSLTGAGASSTGPHNLANLSIRGHSGHAGT